MINMNNAFFKTFDGNEFRVSLYIDERSHICNKEKKMKINWQYYGLLFIKSEFKEYLLNKLLSYLEENSLTIEDEIHYSEIERKKFKTAKRWIDEFINSALESRISWFYFFGVDMNNVNKKVWKGTKKERNDKIYDRFLEIAIKSALSWFFKNNGLDVSKLNVSNIIIDYKDRSYKYALKFVLENLGKEMRGFKPKIIFPKRIIPIRSDYEVSRDTNSIFLQLCDILVGCFAQLLDNSSSNKYKCSLALELKETLETIMEANEAIIRKNKNKRYTILDNIQISFFPKKKSSESEIMSKNYEMNLFYSVRKLKMIEDNLPKFPGF